MRNRILVFYFLEYIFSEYIRDDSGILFTPIEYPLASKAILKVNEVKKESYEYFKRIYLKYYTRLNVEEFRSKLFYDAIYVDPKESYKYYLDLLSNNSASENVLFDTHIALGYLNFKYPHLEKNLGDNILITSKFKYSNVIKALYNLDFDKEKLLDLIETDVDVDSCWGNRYLSVIAAFAFTKHILNKCSISEQKNNIRELLLSYKNLKNNYFSEHELDFPVYEYLLEDISSMLFHNLLGKEKVSDSKSLSEIQSLFLDLLSKEYNTHTYSMLYAGVLPLGYTKEQVDKIYNIHNLE